MTREEAYSRIKEVKDSAWGWHMGGEVLGIPYNEFCEIMSVAISALKGPTREQVEKMRGEWIDKRALSDAPVECSNCGEWAYGKLQDANFCPFCGVPMTDEAIDMTMKRLEEVFQSEKS